MNTIRHGAKTIVAATLLLGLPAHAENVRIDAFEKRAPITDGEQSIRRAELGFQILMGSSQNDLADVHVFDADGQLVPSNTYHLRARGETMDSEVDLQFFPFDEQAGVDAIRYSFELRQDHHNTQIELSADDKGRANPREKTNYVVHIPKAMRKSHGALSELTLDWDQPHANLIVPMRVEGSTDLQSWRTLAERAVVSDLTHNGTSLKRNKIKFPRFTGAYLRLTWPDTTSQFELREIMGKFTRSRVQPAQLRRHTITCAPITADTCEFEIAPQMSVQRINIPLELSQYFVQSTLFTPGRRKDQWVQRATLQQYRLTVDGQEIRNADLSFPNTTDRRWQLRFDQALADLGVMEIEVHWYPVYQAFLAQGQGPYQLAYGHAEAINPMRKTMDKVMKRTGKPIEKIELVNLGPVRFVEVVEVFWTRQRLEVFALWAVLIIGVGVLSRIAWGLFRSLNASADS